MKKYLIIQTAFLGDVVLALPLAEYIKRKVSNSEVTMVVIPGAKPIADLCPSIDRVVSYDKRNIHSGIKGLMAFKSVFADEEFDAIFSPHRSIRTTIISRLLNAVHTYGFDKSAFSFLYKTLVRYRQEEHEIQRNLSLGRKHFRDTGDEIIFPNLELPSDKTNYIVIAPGSVWNTKRFPEHKWIELISHEFLADKQIILIGSKEEIPIGEKIIREVGKKHLFLENRIGQDSLSQTIRIIANGKLVISNDSAPQHIAVAVKTPVITIFGSTVPAFGFNPLGEFDTVIETDQILKCRPCGIHGKKKCPIKTFDCMESIEVESIVSAIKKILSNNPL